MTKGEVVLVTGGAGFLGQHVVKHLMTRADWVETVRVFDVQPFHNYLDYEEKKKCESIVGDITNMNELSEAMNGVSTVFHTASIVDVTMFPDLKKLQRVNVEGTRNVIAACKQHNVSKLVYTSSAGIVCGQESIVNGDESLPIVKKECLDPFAREYAATKAEAESLVTRAHGDKLDNGSNLRTLAIRPVGMYGELDRTTGMSETIAGLTSWKSGGTIPRLPLERKLQLSYVGNVAWAQQVAAEALSHDHKVGGQGYFITDNTQILNLNQFVEPYLNRHGFRYTSWAVPIFLCVMILSVVKLAISLIRCFKPKVNFPLSTHAFENFNITYDFSRKRAEEMLGYKPLYSVEEVNELCCVYYDDVEIQKKVLHSRKST